MADDILTLSDATFDETIGGSDTPVLVDFWAEWCGPCKMIAPTLAEIASEQRGKLTIGKLNVDDNPDTARRFDVMSIPTLLVFKDGEQVKRLVGAKGKGQLLQDLAEFIGLSDPAVPAGRAAAARRSATSSVRLGALGSRDPAGRRARARSAPPPSGVVRAFQEARGLRVDGICGRADLGGARRERLRASATGCSTAAGRCCAATTSPSSSAGSTRSASTPAARTASSATTPTGALIEFQRNIGLPTDGICGADHRSPCSTASAGWPRARWPACASARRCAAVRTGSSGRRVFVAAAPGFETLADAVVRGLAELGAGAVLDASGADDPVLAAEANRYAADLFLALPRRRRARAAGAATSSRAASAPRPGYAVADAVSARAGAVLGGEPVRRRARLRRAPRDPHGRGGLRAGGRRPTSTACARSCVRGADVAHAVVRGVRRGVEQPPTETATDD